MSADEKPFHHQLRARRIIVTAVALVLLCLFLWRVIDVFKPGAYSAVAFNSDGAIPVLMANNDRALTPFDFYYYGHDRWGAWPVLLPNIIHRFTGYHWTPKAMSIVQAIWLLLAALVVGGLSRRDGAFAGLAFLLAVFVLGDPLHQVFLLSHVFAWQIPVLLAGWYCLRRCFDRRAENDSTQVPWLIAVFIFSYLAVWSSVTSIPFLFFLFVLEALQSRLRADATLHPWPPGKSLLVLFPLVAAVVLERLQVLLYHRYTIAHYGTDYGTSFAVDFGHLAQNFGMQLWRMTQSPAWPLILLTLATVLAILFRVGYAWVAKRNPSRETVKALLASETVVLVAGSSGIALINLILATVVTHVRVNDFDQRYLLLTNLFGSLAGVLILFLIAKTVTQDTRFSLWVKPVFVVVGIVLLTIGFPRKTHWPEYSPFENAANALAEKSPRGVLLGDYWSAYVLSALQPINTMTPVPFEGQLNRMPWTRSIVATANEIIVQYPSRQLDRFAKPADSLSQYGATFRLAEPVWYENNLFAFARYVRDRAGAADNARTKSEFLARQPFVLVLDREPQPLELEKATAEISRCLEEPGCLLEQQVRANLALIDSPEFHAGGGFIYRLYLAALGRAPNYFEWDQSRRRLSEHRNEVTAFLQEWVREPEFLERYPDSLSSDEFIEKLIQTAAIPRSSKKEFATRESALIDTANRLGSITANDQAFVTLCYFLYLKRDPDAQGMKYWLSTLRRSQGKILVISGFITSAEYRAKFPTL